MQRLLAYITGSLAVVIVAAAAISATVFSVKNGWETLHALALATLSGIGMAVGGCLGSALILRFKVARRFIAGFINDIHKHPGGHP